ncbi:MAG: hypothetical protein SGCHY_000973 [Lobulomycetales sp.]
MLTSMTFFKMRHIFFEDNIDGGIIRNESCFLVKNNGITLNSQPGNLLNINSQKFVNVASQPLMITSAGTRGVKVTKRKFGAPLTANSKALHSTVLARNARKSKASLDALLKWYRPDLKDAAAARASRIFASQRDVKPSRAAIRKGRARK